MEIGTLSKSILLGSLILITIVIINVEKEPQPTEKPVEKFQQITIAAMPYSFTGYTIHIADKKGFFTEQGLAVKLNRAYPHGMATLNALTTGEAQIAASSETPFINSIINGAKLYTIATTITADDHLAVVARKDSHIASAKDLKNKKIGVTIGSNGEYFLDMVLQLNGLSRENVLIHNLKPAKMVEKLLGEEVDAIVAWNPQKIKAIKELGKNAISFNADGLYSPLFIVATTQAFALSNPETIKKLLRALLSATQYIKANPEESSRIVTKEIKTDLDLLHEMTASYHFDLSLNQSFLTTLENEAYWVLKNKQVPTNKTPDFLDYIYLDALAAISPEKVTIIR